MPVHGTFQNGSKASAAWFHGATLGQVEGQEELVPQGQSTKHPALGAGMGWENALGEGTLCLFREHGWEA